MDDVIVIGGGVIGLSIALELAGQGTAVAVLDQSDFGREASWAGAGILPPGSLENAATAEARLRAYSHSAWPEWAEMLQSETGISTGYNRCGGLEVRFDRRTTGLCEEHHARQPADLRDEIGVWQDEGVRVEELPAAALRVLEPEISAEIAAAYRLPELGQVRNPRLLKALVSACAERGVRLLAGTPAIGFEERNRQIISVRTPTGVLRAGRFCVAGGAWSRTILASIGIDVTIEPVRGQIVLLSQNPKPFSHVIQVGPRYLVPRNDGRILIGATEEHVGFLKANTAEAVSELIAFGVRLVPALSSAQFERAWSGLRPGSRDGLPYLGRVAGYENLFLAAGHFRSGLQMSPGTARLMRQSLLDQETDLPLEPFACDRDRRAVSDRV